MEQVFFQLKRANGKLCQQDALVSKIVAKGKSFVDQRRPEVAHL